ncbi:glycosyltransferase family 1 protein [Candidatus Saccharibacteria bacterium]|nr:MAG: glycosyltransferase family 1 protein [Candidatus Saccharibacteria bacterium]
MTMSTSTKKLNIVYLVSTPLRDISGGVRVITYHIDGLLELGHTVEMWVPKGYGLEPYFFTNTPIREVENLDATNLNKPDIVVLCDPSLLGIVARRRKKPGTFLLLQHDMQYLYEVDETTHKVSPLQEHADYLRTACRIIVVSDWIKDALQARLGLTSFVVRNGVDKALFHPDSEPLVRSKEPVALIFYDPQPWKGFNDVMQALVGVKGQVPELRIAIISQGFPVAAEVGSSYSYTFPVIYFNRPDQRDMAKVFSSASVFISASWQEGFGLPGLEAMACGVPLVTTDSGGVREYAIPNTTALVTPPRDIPALTEAVMEVLRDEKLRARLSHSGLEKAEQFSWPSSIKRLVILFRQYA